MEVTGDLDKQVWCSDGDQSLSGVFFRGELQIRGTKLQEQESREWGEKHFYFKDGESYSTLV